MSSENDIVEQTTVSYEYRVPGAAVETAGDRDAREALAGEVPVDTLVPQQPAPHVDSRDPEANYRSRVNIVADGAGTVADFIND